MTAPVPVPVLPHACRCGKRWSGLSTAHCGATKGSTVLALTAWDGDPGFLAHRYAEFYQRPVDDGRVTTDALADLVGTQSGPVQHASFLVPDQGFRAVDRTVFLGGEGHKVALAVIRPVKVSVVNLVFGRNPAVEHPVLVGFDVLPITDMPAEQDVSMATQVPTRYARRDLLATAEGANRSPIGPGRATGVTPPTLPGARHGRTAVSTGLGNGEHADMIVQVSTLCHLTFSSVSAFDQHRRTGRNTPRACQDPVSSGLVERERAGYTVWGFPAPEDGEGFRGYPD